MCYFSSGVEGVGAGAPQKFWFVGNLGKIPKNLGKIPENPSKSLKISAKFLKILEKMATNVV